jgi:DNA-binding CsgD family transcriptional regulator
VDLDARERIMARYREHTVRFDALAKRASPPTTPTVSVISRVGGSKERLSIREFDVLRLVADGFTDAEIGRRLFIQSETVKGHLRRIYPKLGARNRAHAVGLAFRGDLFTH